MTTAYATRPRSTRHRPATETTATRAAVGLTPLELETVVILCAAQVCGKPGATIEQMAGKLGRLPAHNMMPLVRGAWVEQIARIAGTTTRVWAATPRAFERLGLKGWRVEGDEVARAVVEELEKP